MSQLYARVFVQILGSSIAEDFTLRHVFEDFLKLADHKTGTVDVTRQALSRTLNIPIDVLNEKINKLESPDPLSRDSQNEGRRLERLDQHRDWGWRIVNWEKYDSIKNRADVAVRVAQHRAKKKVLPQTPEKPQDETKTAEINLRDQAKKIIEHICVKTGRSFRPIPATLTVICARLSEPGVTYEGCIKMINRQCDRWKGTEFEEYVRPETLFRASKFNGYYASKDAPISQSGEQRVDRSVGTTNQGTSDLFAGLGKVGGSKNVQRPAA